LGVGQALHKETLLLALSPQTTLLFVKDLAPPPSTLPEVPLYPTCIFLYFFFFLLPGLLYMLIAMVSMCYWVQGMTKRKEWEDLEQEEASLLGGGGKNMAEAELTE
jgi:hypothetical protein